VGARGWGRGHLELLREVASVEDEAISGHGGSLVKRLGDGSMSVFGGAEDAVRAALDTHEAVGSIDVHGYTLTLRAGVHLGRPRRVGGDYLGVDVNIAARVGECSKPGEVLVSDPAHAALDASVSGSGAGGACRSQARRETSRSGRSSRRAPRASPVLYEGIGRDAVVGILERRRGPVRIDPRLARMGLQERIIGYPVDRRVLDRTAESVDEPRPCPAGTTRCIVLLSFPGEIHPSQAPFPVVWRGNPPKRQIQDPRTSQLFRRVRGVKVRLVRCRYKLEAQGD
jgi:Adenylate and Guanylate cyclase catalytic domain